MKGPLNSASDFVDWRRLHEFADVDLTQSYVISWHVEGEALFVDIDLFLTPQHPFYEKPRPAEKVCIRPAVIEFPHCDSLRVDGAPSGKVVDIAAKIDHGSISGLRRLGSGHYEISGDFGTVDVDAERPILRLKKP
jgi:hypothetical protein